MSEITGMLAIGNGEKCPYCDTVMKEDTDIFKHMTENHEDKLIEALFGDLKTDMDNIKQKGQSNENNKKQGSW